MHTTYILPHNKIQTQRGVVMSFFTLLSEDLVGGGGGGGHAPAQEVQTCMCMSE